MHTSLILVALLMPTEVLETQKQTLTWQDSYSTARQLGRQQDKPLAVFVGKGPTGWKKVAEEGALSEKASRLLSRNYICLYVDRTQPGGKVLAESFDVSSGPGLVVSSRDGQSQAFFHVGRLTADDLESRLAKYSAHVVTRTEQLIDTRVSFAYQPTSSGAYNARPTESYTPASYGNSSPSYGGSSPSYGGSSPSYGGSSPYSGGSSPSYGGSSPSYGGSSPSYGGSSPSYGGARSSGNC